jgi:hypothetical protein
MPSDHWLSDHPLQIGRLLRAGTSGFVVGCRVSQLDSPKFGGLVRVPLKSDYEIFGLIHNIAIDDDGLVRQLVTAPGIDETIIQDNRANRNVPIEISVLTVGYRQGARVFHLLPPTPPLSLDLIYLCDGPDLCNFTGSRFGYFRHILRAIETPTGELLAAHLLDARDKKIAQGDPDWINRAMQELIILLRDDYVSLMAVLGALSDVLSAANAEDLEF